MGMGMVSAAEIECEQMFGLAYRKSKSTIIMFIALMAQP